MYTLESVTWILVLNQPCMTPVFTQRHARQGVKWKMHADKQRKALCSGQAYMQRQRAVLCIIFPCRLWQLSVETS